MNIASFPSILVPYPSLFIRPRVSKVAKEETEKLIELLRENPCVYAQSCREYKDPVLQYNI